MEESINGKICYRLRRIGAPATMQDVADVFVLQQNITVIGRAKHNVDLFIDSSKNKALISRIHARISKSQTQCGKDVFKIHDVSLNGTYVNDVKISTEALLKPGDVVVFGHVQGACLQSGNCYKQLNSEFKFLFESFYNEAGNDLTNIDYETKHTHEATMETPITSTMLSENCPTTRRMLSFENSDDNDYNMLQEYASNAVSSFTKENESFIESDEDLLPVKYTQILPHASYEKNKSTKSPERKRRRSQQPTDDTCSASKCTKPEGKIISWVQCDDCDEWYHVKCCGLSLRLVKVKNSKFHCGCS